MNPDATFKPKINPRSDMIASRKKLNGTGTQSEAFLRLTQQQTEDEESRPNTARQTAKK